MATLRDFERATGITVVTRDQWGARRPRFEPAAWRMPCDNVWVHHAATEGTDDAAEMRLHQRFHMDTKGWSDIFYNVAVPDPNPGLVFEGRGIGRTSEDRDWAEILVMGNFEVDRPGQRTLDVLAALLRFGIDHGWWRNNIAGHRDKPAGQGQTACPGRYLYARLPDVRARVNAGPVTPEEDDFMAALSEKAQRKLAQDAAAAAFLGHANLDINRKTLKAAMFADTGELMQYTARIREEFGAEEGETVEDVLDRYGRELVELFKAAEE